MLICFSTCFHSPANLSSRPKSSRKGIKSIVHHSEAMQIDHRPHSITKNLSSAMQRSSFMIHHPESLISRVENARHPSLTIPCRSSITHHSQFPLHRPSSITHHSSFLVPHPSSSFHQPWHTIHSWLINHQSVIIFHWWYQKDKVTDFELYQYAWTLVNHLSSVFDPPSWVF